MFAALSTSGPARRTASRSTDSRSCTRRHRRSRRRSTASPNMPPNGRACVSRISWSVDAVCVRLGTVIGPWERDTGARDNFGTHSQLARLAVRGEAAILTAREVQRDWVYAKDVAHALSE